MTAFSDLKLPVPKAMSYTSALLDSVVLSSTTAVLARGRDIQALSESKGIIERYVTFHEDLHIWPEHDVCEVEESTVRSRSSEPHHRVACSHLGTFIIKVTVTVMTFVKG